MKIAFYNPPSSTPIIRRYMCSYNAGENRYPCVELLGMAALSRQLGHQVAYIDCVAEELNTADAVAKLQAIDPDLMVCLTGVECFHEDIAELSALKKALPGVAVGLFGYYPTIYAARCIESGFDFVLMGEGEKGLTAYLTGVKDAPGLATPEAVSPDAPRLTESEYNALPHPAHDLLKIDLYRELGMGSPMTAVQFTRGCPFPCAYCIRSYGRKTTRRTVENVMRELKTISNLGIKYFRILDDTFNVNKEWTSQVCQSMIEQGLNLSWAALSRVDTLDEKILRLMRQAGCKRIFIGIESGSQRVIDYYKKGYDVRAIPEKVRQVRRAGLEAVGFFLMGTAFETWEDVKLSIDLSKKCDLDFIIATKLVIYPGTDLVGEMGSLAHVDPWTGKHSFVDSKRENDLLMWERRFYRSFYFSRHGFRTGIKTFLKNPPEAFRAAYGLVKYALLPKNSRSHPDYL